MTLSIILRNEHQLGLGTKTFAKKEVERKLAIAAELESRLLKVEKKRGRILVTGIALSRTAISNTNQYRSLCFQ